MRVCIFVYSITAVATDVTCLISYLFQLDIYLIRATRKNAVRLRSRRQGRTSPPSGKGCKASETRQKMTADLPWKRLSSRRYRRFVGALHVYVCVLP